jgi:hypothetical protein
LREKTFKDDNVVLTVAKTNKKSHFSSSWPFSRAQRSRKMFWTFWSVYYQTISSLWPFTSPPTPSLSRLSLSHFVRFSVVTKSKKALTPARSHALFVTVCHTLSQIRKENNDPPPPTTTTCCPRTRFMKPLPFLFHFPSCELLGFQKPLPPPTHTHTHHSVTLSLRKKLSQRLRFFVSALCWRVKCVVFVIFSKDSPVPFSQWKGMCGNFESAINLKKSVQWCFCSTEITVIQKTCQDGWGVCVCVVAVLRTNFPADFGMRRYETEKKRIQGWIMWAGSKKGPRIFAAPQNMAVLQTKLKSVRRLQVSQI